MALVNCPDCGNQISNQAQACPKCGHPIKTTQKVYITNAKKGKGKKTTGAFLMLIALVAAIGSTGHNGTSGLMFFIGLLLFVFGKIENWWHWK